MCFTTGSPWAWWIYLRSKIISSDAITICKPRRYVLWRTFGISFGQLFYHLSLQLSIHYSQLRVAQSLKNKFLNSKLLRSSNSNIILSIIDRYPCSPHPSPNSRDPNQASNPFLSAIFIIWSLEFRLPNSTCSVQGFSLD